MENERDEIFSGFVWVESYFSRDISVNQEEASTMRESCAEVKSHDFFEKFQLKFDRKNLHKAL